MAVERLTQASIGTLNKYSSMMAGSTLTDYQLITTQVLGTTATTVTFSGLNTSAINYKHLQLRMTAKSDNANEGNAYIRFNADTAANYSRHTLYSSAGTSVASFGAASTTLIEALVTPGTGAGTSIFGAAVTDILDWQATKNKVVRSFSGYVGASLNAPLQFMSGSWYNTGAVTSIVITATYGNFIAGSRFSLYGWN